MELILLIYKSCVMNGRKPGAQRNPSKEFDKTRKKFLTNSLVCDNISKFAAEPTGEAKSEQNSTL